MDYNCTKSITTGYIKFIDFALSKSDSIAFHIVHYDILSPDELAMRKEYQKLHPEEPNEEIVVNYEYYERMAELIKPIKKAILQKENAFSYLGYGYGHLCETFIVNAKHPNVRKFLCAVDSIFSWQYPDFPEDVSFISQGKCWARNVAHEKLLFFEDITDIEVEYLTGIGIELIPDI